MGKYLGSTGLTYLWGKIKSLLANGTAGRAQGIPFGTVDSTSTATAFTATVEGITELKNGTCVYLINGVVTSAAASTAPKCWTLNINGLGAKPVYVTTAAVTYSTTHFTKNYKMLFTYDESLNSGNGGWYIGQLFNSNTTYSDMTQAEITAGTGTTGRKITPKMLRDNFYTESEVDTLLGSKANSNDLATVATSGSYNDLDDTPTIPAAVTESTVSGWGFTKNTGTYSKPSGGIPASDLANAVQTSLGKADTALQSFTESDPTVPSHIKGITTTDISNWNGKQAAIADLSDIRNGAALGATALQSYTETDPTVPAWAKAANKPSYTASEVGALPDSTVIPTEATVTGWGFTKNTGNVSSTSVTNIVYLTEAQYEALATKDSSTLYIIPSS